MKLLRAISLLRVLLIMAAADSAHAEEPSALTPRLAAYVEARVAEFGKIPSRRKTTLQEVSDYVREQTTQNGTATLTFICTHNSRRSHLSQLWGATAAAYYGVDGVETFSGGTESTAFNPRAVAAVRRAGFEVTVSESGENPRYEVKPGEGVSPQVCFSKKYNQPPNPTSDFCAVMTCTDADRRCPLVAGAAARIALPFEDPKVADGTPIEAQKYDERCAQIAREMLYAFSRIGREHAETKRP